MNMPLRRLDPVVLDKQRHGHIVEVRGQNTRTMHCGKCGKSIRRVLDTPDWVHL